MAVKRSSAPATSDLSPSGSSEVELSGALHEVSNALTVVMGWLAEAREKLAPGAVREALDVAYTHARRGHAVARRAIGAPVADAGEVRSAVSLARDAILGARQEASRKGVQVELDGPEDDGLVCDAGYALQILMNLLLNAIAFSPEGGVVHVGVVSSSGEILFSVHDEGPGVPEDLRDRIFQGGDSRRPGGSGIGLAYCYGLAATVGGRLSLATTERGARFELSWPAGEAPSTTLQRVVSPATLRGMRVLVLEDDVAVTCLLELGLGSQGVEMVSVANSKALLEAAARNGGYDAALLDFSPIEADPAGVFAELRLAQPDIPILLMSGSSMASEVDSAVFGWIRKPFELAEVYEALRRIAAT